MHNTPACRSLMLNTAAFLLFLWESEKGLRSGGASRPPGATVQQGRSRRCPSRATPPSARSWGKAAAFTNPRTLAAHPAPRETNGPFLKERARVDTRSAQKHEQRSLS